jgi:signal transduction histidine kinase/integral membrane sensor domain MASE1
MPRLVARARIVATAAASPLAVALAYCLSAKLGQLLAFPDAPVSALWAPNAILLAALLLAPRERWWLYLVAVLPFHVLVQLPVAPFGQVVTQYVLNCSEALLGALPLVTRLSQPLRFDNLRSAFFLVAFAAFLAPLVTSIAMAAVFVALGISQEFWLTATVRTITNTFAIVTLVPLIVHGAQWIRTSPGSLKSGAVVEAAALTVCLVVVGILVFAVTDAGPALSPTLVYAPLPLLLWATIRFGILGACGSALLMGAVSTWGVLHGHGPFTAQQPVQNAVSLVLFQVASSAPLVLVAALLSELKRARAARERAEALHSMIIASLRNHVAVLQYDGVVVEANDSWRRFAENKPAHPWDRVVAGANFLTACADAAAQGDEAANALLIATRAVLDGSSLHHKAEYAVRAQHDTRWFELTIQTLHRTGGGAILLRSDVTADKKAESDASEQHRQFAQLNRVAALGELSGAYSHELSQPLTAILLNAGRALHLLNREPADLAEVRFTLEEIAREDERAVDIVQRRWLAMDDEYSEHAAVELHRLVLDVVELVRRTLLSHPITIRTDFDTEVPTVRANYVRLKQVILNLVMNACDAMDDVAGDKRVVTIATRARPDAGSVEISVTDGGPGIVPGDEERIFAPFFTTKDQGVGLGLSICRSIVDAHGGRLWAENVTGGATFRFTVPCVESSDEWHEPDDIRR